MVSRVSEALGAFFGGDLADITITLADGSQIKVTAAEVIQRDQRREQFEIEIDEPLRLRLLEARRQHFRKHHPEVLGLSRGEPVDSVFVGTLQEFFQRRRRR